MSARDAGLNADPDPMWMHVVLTVREIREQTLRTIAEMHAEDPSRLRDLLDQLAAGLDRPAEGWDESVSDFEADAQMDEASVELDERRARQLAAELDVAADRTMSARVRADRPLTIPRKQDRRAA